MFTRISSALLLTTALAACDMAKAPEKPTETMACAVGGSPKFDGVCRVERNVVPGGSTVTVFHPDGSFRRFEVEGELVRTADGADAAVSVVQSQFTEVTVGSDHYRFPPPAPPVAPDKK